VFELRLLRRIIGTKRESVIRGWRKLLNVEHFKIIGMNKW
jgi:hypothetical protein